MVTKKYKDFVMVEASNPSDFRNEVNRFLDAGYEFHDVPTILVIPMDNHEYRMSYNQALVLTA